MKSNSSKKRDVVGKCYSVNISSHQARSVLMWEEDFPPHTLECEGCFGLFLNHNTFTFSQINVTATVNPSNFLILQPCTTFHFQRSSGQSWTMQITRAGNCTSAACRNLSTGFSFYSTSLCSRTSIHMQANTPDRPQSLTQAYQAMFLSIASLSSCLQLPVSNQLCVNVASIFPLICIC